MIAVWSQYVPNYFGHDAIDGWTKYLLRYRVIRCSFLLAWMHGLKHGWLSITQNSSRFKIRSLILTAYLLVPILIGSNKSGPINVNELTLQISSLSKQMNCCGRWVETGVSGSGHSPLLALNSWCSITSRTSACHVISTWGSPTPYQITLC